MKLMLHCLAAVLWAALIHAGPLWQSADLILFSATPELVRPGEAVTLAWAVPGTFQELDHVTIEMSHPWLTDRVVFHDLPRTGTLTVSVPPDYFDVAHFRLYPEMAGDIRYKGANGVYVSARLEVVVDDGVAVTQLQADPNPAPRGNSVSISWEVTGLDPDTATVYLWYYGNDGIWDRTGDLPPVGTTVLEPPPYYTESFTVYLAAEKVGTGNALDIDILCPFEEYLGSVCPFTHEEVTLPYQPFEHGLMLLRDGKILIVYDSGSFSERHPEANDPTSAELTPPEGFYSPAPDFAGLWSDGYLADSLGWATGPETSYNTIFETIPDTAGRHRVTGYLFYLPSGELIHANSLRLYWWKPDELR
jgi:hypothetical protein